MEWFREILELITSPDVGPAEHQGKRTQFTAISETSPDLRLFPDFVIFVILYIKINIACSRRCGFMKSNSLRHEIQFPQRHISNLIQLTVHLSMFPIFNVTQVFQFTNMSSYQKRISIDKYLEKIANIILSHVTSVLPLSPQNC